MGKVYTNRSKKMKEVCGGSGEAKPTGKKRKNEVTSKDKDVSAKQSKKASSQKLEWSEEEEIRVLLGMTDFKAITRKNPFDDMNGAYEFLQEYISVDVNDFVEKMKSLKKKLMGQVRINAKEPSSSEPHGHTSSELLKLIWGYDVESAVEKPKKSKRIIKPKEEEDKLTVDKKLQSPSHSAETKASSEKDEPNDKKKTPSASVVATAKTKKAKKEVCVSGEAKKRVREETSTEDVNAAKRAKKDVKKPNNQRLWSEEDEILVLQGIIAFKSETGKTTSEDKSGFYEFIKDSISVKVSLSQCIEKIKTVKRKFMNRWKYDRKPTFSRAHDMKSFELSKMIWGLDDVDSRKSERVKKLEKDEGLMILEQGDDWFHNSFLVRSIASFGVSEDSVKRRWSLVHTEKKKMLEDKWRVLTTNEAKFVLQKIELLHEVVSLIIDVEASTH
ncbi:GLABROUS1 enhancer-binding protein family [Arabidopsis thaliana x Arabidopsis arenosa]|uniref:GLABROUS1 enhancer-binding protein family n=1 Tax=Arabidopsis thaliana x Arabidopsis arenosa TaxID=1240361 RepID=A0A8T1YE76_9BRAS|nr:GLABROUS1 enhancer-binding protein family [Arabidopsis thaliana x Arabidopsis arenosa]